MNLEEEEVQSCKLYVQNTKKEEKDRNHALFIIPELHKHARQ